MPEGAFGNTEKSFCGAGTRPFIAPESIRLYAAGSGPPPLLHRHRHLRWE